MESVKSYFETYLSVNFYDMMYAATTRNCGVGELSVTFPAVAPAQPFDLYIMIKPQNDINTSYFAAATSCDKSAVDNRPFSGIYYLNFAKMEGTKIKEYFYFSTYAHEFTHILGFSSSQFGLFKDTNGNTIPENQVVGQMTIGLQTFNAIILPQVVNYAQTFFNDPSITKVPLENDGGSGTMGSHWEKAFMPLEFMNAIMESPGIISEFTLTLLRATGWYQIPANAAQVYDWGKDDGPDHFKICPKGREYCEASQKDKYMCSHDH